MAKEIIDSRIPNIATDWDGYKGSRVQEFIKSQITYLGNRITNIGIADFDGVYNLSDLQDPQNDRERADVCGKVIFLSDIGYFVSIEYWDDLTPEYHPEEDWGGANYNITDYTRKYPKSDRLFRFANRLYCGGFKDGVGHLNYLVDSAEFAAILDAKTANLQNDITTIGQKASAVGILPFDGLWPSVGTPWPTRGVWFNPATDTKAAYWSLMSMDNGFTTDDYNETDAENGQIARTNCIYRCGSQLFRIVDGQLAEIGGVTINDDTIITLTTDNI